MGLVTDPYFFRLDFIRKLAAQYARKACSIGYDRQVVSHAIGGAGFVQVLRRGKAVIAGQDTAISQKCSDILVLGHRRCVGLG